MKADWNGDGLLKRSEYLEFMEDFPGGNGKKKDFSDNFQGLTVS